MNRNFNPPVITDKDMFEVRLNKRFDELNEKLDKAITLIQEISKDIEQEDQH
jgi:tetrahydromethanopterin S-methyltransferase subunit G